jgi:hypothetical protein
MDTTGRFNFDQRWFPWIQHDDLTLIRGGFHGYNMMI